MNGGGGKKKKRRKSSAEARRRMSSSTGNDDEDGQKMAMMATNGQAGGGHAAKGTGGGNAPEGGGGLEFSKITERIFALLFPSGSDSAYRQGIKSISERIKRTFPDRYKIFNLSQKRSDLGRANQQGAVLEFGWPDTLAPPLDRLCSICKQLENHLNGSPDNVAIVHCKGGIYRAGIVIAAFMNYTSICSGEENLPDRFSMKLFTEKYLGADAQPSYKRYVHYFAGLLSGTIKVYASPVFLHQISLNKLFTNRTTIVKMKLYERMKPVWSSGKISIRGEHPHFVDIPTNRLSLRGDVLLKCYEPSSSSTNGQSEKRLLFLCQFNTCALGLDSMALPKVTFHRDDLDFMFIDKSVDNGASLELSFELTPTTSEARRSNTPKRGKSASPGRANLPTGGDFSRADSYENFDRAEDDRSLSLPLGTTVNGQDKAAVDELTTLTNGKKPNSNLEQQPTTPLILHPHHHPTSAASNQHTPLTTDGADSGIGSDSPKGAAASGVTGQQTNNIGGGEAEEEEYEEIGAGEKVSKKMPPPVPPKVRRHSSVESVEEQPSHPPNPHRHFEPDDPLRGAIEDSTIGRDHSVLPPGVRPNRRHSTHAAQQQDGGAGGANSGSSGDESRAPPPSKRVIISPMVQPELVASGRYDPNSRCFSYVPAKSLRAHYQAPKKPALKRRTSVVEPADLEVSPLEAKMALENFGLQGSSGDLRRRAETPKWEAEIDRVTGGGKIEPALAERRARRASTSGTPVGHLQRDYVRSPSAQIRPQDEWRHRQQPQQQQQKYTPSHWNWSSDGRRQQPPYPASEQQQQQERYLPNGYVPTGTGGWSTPQLGGGTTASHTVPRQAAGGRGDQQQFRHPMAVSMPAAERPMVVDQAKRATPTPVARYSPQLRPGQRIPGVRPSPRRAEMDALCDPDFYLSYSTPTASPALGRKPAEVEERKGAPPARDAPLSKSVPNDRAFRQIAQNELLGDDVRTLLAQHTMPVHHRYNFGTTGQRSQTPQNHGGAGKYVPPRAQEEYRGRNCRSVNSTPLIGGRKLFVHTDLDEPATDPEERGAEGWLHAKLAALNNRRYMGGGGGPMAKSRREAEQMLLEELKSKAAKLATSDDKVGGGTAQQRSGGRGGGDPVEEYRRETERLKNTQSPLVVLDGLRQANRNLQKERAKQGYYGINPQSNQQVPQPIATSFPAGIQYNNPAPGQLRSFSVTPGAVSSSFSASMTPIRSSFHPQQYQNAVAESPTPSGTNARRGATPTGQIVRGKPPTPPPTRVDHRERSRSPYSATKLLRGSSNSAPPFSAMMAKRAAPEGEAAVNPSLYALRQSLYAKERERMGIEPSDEGGGGGGQQLDWIDDEWAPPPPDGEEQWTTPRQHAHPPAYGQQNNIAASRNNPQAAANPSSIPHSSASIFAYGAPAQHQNGANNGGNGGGGTNRSTPVKPILKRSQNGQNGGQGNGGAGNESPMLQRKQMAQQPPMMETPNEESFVPPPHHQLGRHPQQQQQLGHSSTPANWLTERSDTPQFPVPAETSATPLPYHPLLYRTSEDQQGEGMPPTAKSGTFPGIGGAINNNNNRLANTMTPHSMYGGAGPHGFSRRSSLTSIDAGEVIHHHPIFVKDTSRFWYKPTISREEAINMLKNKPPGTFVVRDSNSFPGAFGLALKVSQAPAGVTANDGSELVRHFLIEPSTKGVRLKGCSNEPVFGTLAALVYQHSITPLALPSRLILPEYDPASSPEHLNSNQALLERGAACNVTYLCSVDTESLTGPEAVRRSAAFAFELLQRRELRAVPVHFKVSSQGVTLTDNTRSLFFRRHYPVNSVTFAGIDPESRVFDNNNVAQLPPTYVRQAPLFGFVARKLPANGFNGSNTSVENACHIFAELDPDQPASAVVRFIANVMMPAGRVQLQQIHQNANAVH